MPVRARHGVPIDPRDLPERRPAVSETEAATVEIESDEEIPEEAPEEPPLPEEEVPPTEEKCSDCHQIIVIGAWPWCPHPPANPHTPFKPFVADVGGKQVVIDSIQAAARVERETMKQYRDGSGVQPLVFRAFHQDRSNFDVNCLGPNPQKKPGVGFSKTTKRGVPFVNRARS